MSKIFSLLLVVIFFSISSCVSFKKVAYFRNLPDSATVSRLAMPPFASPVIKSDDLLNINIQSLDPSISQLINSANVVMPALGASSAYVSNQTQLVSGYLVDKNGEIEIPFLGKIKLEGLTSIEAREYIKNGLSKYIKDPIVSVRFVNFKITVLGEVARPSTYLIPSEKISLLDAISLAGDLTIYGKRDNVMLVRAREGYNDVIRLNLNSKDILTSPYFYLQPNDLVYVEPNRAKIANSDGRQFRYLGIVTSILSIVLVFLIRVLK